MMRKFNKKKGSRQGAILVTVVFILAFAMIFIAAAMMLTQATRKRVYEEAESNQARLTVTSVSEAFYRAVQKCEFEDSVLINLCKSSPPIHVETSSTVDRIPGLEVSGVSNPANSYTTVKFSRKKTGSGATNPNDDYTYYADFSTHIDGKVENVRAELSYVTPPGDTNTSPFNTQFDHNSVFTKNNMADVGAGKSGDPNNVFLVRKGADTDNSSFSSVATMVYCDGNITFKDENFKSTDIVFLQGAKLKKGDSGKFKPGHVKNLFFFGSGTERISDDADRGNFKDVATGLTFYLCGRSNFGNWADGCTVININSNGLKTDNTPVFSDKDEQKAFANKVKTYYNYNTQYRAGGTNAFPTTDDFLTSIGNIKNNKVTSKTAPTNPTWSGSLGDFLTTKSYQKNGGSYVTPGTYVFEKDDSDHSQNHPGLGEKEPYIVVLEGGKKYQFWFKSDNYLLHNVVFIVNDPDPAYPVLFLLEDKANVAFNDNGKVCDNGIFAVQGRKKDTAKDMGDYIKDQWNSNLGNPQAFEKEAGGKYSKYYDGSNEPCAMVIGMGHNTFLIEQNVIIEAFIGLFNDSYGSETKSTLKVRNLVNGVLYARVMTDGFEDKDSGGDGWYMPATPGASSLPSPNPPFKKVVTGFSLNSMKYYYGIAPE
ncbi:MAG: hypothetical protein K6E60_02455 [Saccharofermentans sp.]|nr:hypothetical protein [Saccharofermentans sp.]